jgi:hypothetical protein
MVLTDTVGSEIEGKLKTAWGESSPDEGENTAGE